MPILGKRVFLSIYQTKHTVQFCNTLFSLHFKLDTCVPECNTIGVQTPNNECADSCSDESIQGSSLMPILGKRVFLSIYQTKHTVQFCNTLFSLHFKLDTCVPECNTIGTMPSFLTLSVATNRKKRDCKDTK